MLRNIGNSMAEKTKLVAIAKDEGRYLPEWVFHHAYFGFDSFDIYINNTSDNSIIVLNELSKQFNINVINADAMYLEEPASFQRRAYNHALKNTDNKEYGYVAFLDIDEFWTPKDFKTKVSTYLSKSKHFDVILFNWMIHQSESDFNRCFSEHNLLVLDSHVKYMVRLGKKMNPNIHNAHGKNLCYVTSEFNEANFTDESKAKISCDSTIPSAFIIHRLYRGQLEYISMLSRGRPRGDRFKTNRNGYYKNNNSAKGFHIDQSLINEYYIRFDILIDELSLKPLISSSEAFVINRYRELLVNIKTGITNFEAKVLNKAFRNITLPEITSHIKILEMKEKNMKIFQIGFNKSGTGSIYQYFKSEGFKSAHWDKGNLSKTIDANFKAGLNLLTGYEDYQVYTDMEHREEDQTAVYSAEKYFKELDKQYPGSIFILNYRDVTKWIKSRINHPGYLKKTMLSTGLTEAKVIEQWKINYHSHINEVELYFEGKNNLITVSLDEDDPKKLYQELSIRGVELKSKELPHTHKTTKGPKTEKQKHVNSIRNAALFFEEEDIQVAYKLMEVANKLRPEGKFIEDKLNHYKLLIENKNI